MISQRRVRVALANYVIDPNGHFKGKYTSLALLQASYPTASAGDYAVVDPGSGINAMEYLWDSDEGWVSPDSGASEVEPFTTVLTFDHDKDMATVTGGTRTFTLGTDNFNGVSIVARINTPTAVNWPAGSEAVSGSDTVSVTDMNIIIFRYFEDYDGLGNGKVLYLVKNQTAV